MNTPSAEARSARAFRLGDFLRDQLRNIAPFITLIVLVGFFSIASPSFASIGNLENILQQVSITAIMAVGLTFVILTAEIDLSVGAIANATAIVLTFFTLQPDYVNIANLPMPGAIAIILALAACGVLGLLTAFGVTRIGIPSFIMTLAMMQIGAGISAVLVRGQIAYSVPPLILTLGSKSIFGVPWIILVAATFLLVAHLVLTYTRFGRYVYMVGGKRPAERVRHLPARRHRCSGGRRNQPLRRTRRHRQHDRGPVRARRPQQRSRLCEDRQFPKNPHPRPDPADRAHHQRLCRAAAHRAQRRTGRLSAWRPMPR
jgi:ribose transport system permease protein